MVAMPAIPALEKLRHEDECEPEVGQVSIREDQLALCLTERFQETFLLENRNTQNQK